MPQDRAALTYIWNSSRQPSAVVKMARGHGAPSDQVGRRARARAVSAASNPVGDNAPSNPAAQQRDEPGRSTRARPSANHAAVSGDVLRWAKANRRSRRSRRLAMISVLAGQGRGRQSSPRQDDAQMGRAHLMISRRRAMRASAMTLPGSGSIASLMPASRGELQQNPARPGSPALPRPRHCRDAPPTYPSVARAGAQRHHGRAPSPGAAATTLAKRGRKARRTVASGWAML